MYFRNYRMRQPWLDKCLKRPVLIERDNLIEPIQMQLSKKQKTVSQFFSAFLKSKSNC